MQSLIFKRKPSDNTMLSALKQYFAPSVQIVAQARQPVFYSQWQVDDTVDGRFDVIILHLFLVLSRLENDGDPSFSQCLQEAFFADMDRSLREMGASDTGVGIRVKNMAQAFYGRMKAYREAMGDETALAEALKRNVYREKPIKAEIVASLAAYMGRNIRALQQQPLETLHKGILRFSS